MTLEMSDSGLRYRSSLRSRSRDRITPNALARQESAECWAFHVARSGRVAAWRKAVTHRGSLADGPVQLLRLGRNYLTVDARTSVQREHVRVLVERKTGGAQPDQGQALQPGSNARRKPATGPLSRRTSDPEADSTVRLSPRSGAVRLRRRTRSRLASS